MSLLVGAAGCISSCGKIESKKDVYEEENEQEEEKSEKDKESEDVRNEKDNEPEEGKNEKNNELEDEEDAINEVDSEHEGNYIKDNTEVRENSDDAYGVFVKAAKLKDGVIDAEMTLENAGFNDGVLIYTPDFSKLNQEPYYVVSSGLFHSEEARVLFVQIPAVHLRRRPEQPRSACLGPRHFG